jgi:outer membrane protein assembly factor BamB/predicted phosphohydrolase
MKDLIRSLFVLFLFTLAGIANAQTKPFRFAWLSDTHVGATTGAADLGLSIRDINTMHDVAFVILSGDITEMGSDTQLELAKAILDSLKKPYYIIPGNHDTKWSASGCTKFSSIWGNDRFTFEYHGYRFIGFQEGPNMKMGDGHFSPEDLRWVDTVLKPLRKKRQPLFIVTHYPLDPGIDNWYEMTDRLKKFNVQAVLVGHGHSNLAMNFEGLPGVMGRSTLRARRPQGAYIIVDVKTDTVYFSERSPGVELRSPWHKLPLGQRDYSRDTAKYERPDYSVNKTYGNVKTRWSVNTGYTIASTPAVWNELVVVGNGGGTVACYSVKSGKILWQHKTGATVYSSPDASDGRVVIGSSDKNLYCFNIRTGAPAWKITTGAPVVAAPVIHEGTVFIGGSDGVFRAVDLKSGTLRWEFAGVGGFVETRPLVYQHKVIFGAWDTRLYALNISDGSLAWKWSNGNDGILLSPAACWPVASEGKVFIAAPDRYLSAVDAGTGTTVWRTKRYQVRETVGVSGDGRRIYARCMTDTVIAFSPTPTSFDVLWVQHCGYGYDIDPSMPLEKDGVVFFGTKNGLVYALDGTTGKILWKHRVGVTIVNTLVPLDARRTIATDLDGTIALLEAK